MTEYRVVCDYVRTDKTGRTWITQGQKPIGKSGNRLLTTFTDKAEAEAIIKKWEQSGKEYVENQIKMEKIIPSNYPYITYQINYRIQSRTVSDWE